MADNENQTGEFELDIDDSALKEELELLDTSEDNQNTAEQEETKPQEQEQILEEPAQTAQKTSKMKYILIGLGVLIVILASVAGLYFGGVFGDVEKNETKSSNNTTETNATSKPKYHFDLEHINPDRLNRKLALLNKYELTEEQLRELLTSKDANETIIYDKEMLQLLAQEEPLKDMNTTNLTESNETKALLVTTKETNATNAETKKIAKKELIKKEEKKVLDNKKKLIYVQFAYLKYTNYKVATSQLKNINAKFSVCKDKNGTKIIIGPLKNNQEKAKIIKSVIEKTSIKDPFGIEMTEAEFEKMCGF